MSAPILGHGLPLGAWCWDRIVECDADAAGPDARENAMRGGRYDEYEPYAIPRRTRGAGKVPDPARQGLSRPLHHFS